MTAEEIFEQYIGNGQMGIDFEKKHIIEAMEAYASHKVAKATKEMYPKDFIMWIGFHSAILYYRDIDEKWIKTRFEMSENPSEEYDEYTLDELFEYWKQDIGK